MKLTLEEKRMLDGEQGDLVREAMEFLVALGEAYGAEQMINISFANVFIASSFWGQGTLTRDLIDEAVRSGVKVKVPTTFNNWGLGCPSTPASIWDDLDVPDKVREQVINENEIAIQLGILPTWTCSPYLVIDTGSFPRGSHITTVESSAIVYYNSVLGARTNRDCMAAFFAAITGKYPACGFHLDENRHAVYQFDVLASMEDSLSFGLLGVFAGKICGMETPVFTGLSLPKSEGLRQLSAALASSGAVSLFHIVGVTPEAPDLKTALGGRKPLERVTVSQDDLDAVYSHLSQGEGGVDFVCLGCPHYSIHEVKEVAELLEGRKVNPNVTLWICTSPQTAILAEMAGYTKKITDAGGMLMSGPAYCPLFGPGRPGPEYTFSHPDYSIGAYATDAVKQAYYAVPNLRAKRVFLGSRAQCIQAAITGEWRIN
ncbi:MAG: aconitase X catalytic domain-containing protein [Candidatus Methanosuratincola sp.]